MKHILYALATLSLCCLGGCSLLYDAEAAVTELRAEHAAERRELADEYALRSEELELQLDANEVSLAGYIAAQNELEREHREAVAEQTAAHWDELKNTLKDEGANVPTSMEELLAWIAGGGVLTGVTTNWLRDRGRLARGEPTGNQKVVVP